jgi:uncharacterized membrane protein
VRPIVLWVTISAYILLYVRYYEAMNDRGKKTIYELFWLSILVKALGSAGEMIAGIAVALVPSTFVLHMALLLSQGDVDGDADDFLARGLSSAAHSFAISNGVLIGAYLFVRGLVQLLLVLALFKNKLWAYPLLLLVLFIFICTQVYEIYLSHSIATGVITVIDLITMYLVWREYTIVRRTIVTAN